MQKFDYVIVGSGLFGAVFAHQMKVRGKSCLVLDRRDHSGGNVYCVNDGGIQVHKYGAHIFHTNDQKIWNFVNQFVKFNEYIHAPLANYKGKIIPLPFNLNTFRSIWDITTEAEARAKIADQTKPFQGKKPQNLEEYALSVLGPDIYEELIKGYTEKQWGMKAIQLPPFILKRLPLDYGTENQYFKDRFQGIPIGGYNGLVDGLLEGIEVRLGIDYLKDRKYWEGLGNKIVYTGPIDEYFDFQLGELEYRGLRFEQIRLEQPIFQQCAVVNYTDSQTPYTRILEHKYFEFGKHSHTVITKEFSENWVKGKEPYYPINDQKNQLLLGRYSTLAALEPHVIFGGRLAEYRYYDMHQVIGSALHKAELEP